MPVVPFESLPDDARVWVFGSDRPVTGPAAERLLGLVDAFLAQWQAHGAPLRCARDWRENRFLTVAVDQSTAGASGCSIDGLFRTLQRLEPELGASLVGGGRVFYRDATGAVVATTREIFGELAAAGAVGPQTSVFDTSLTALGDWRRRFEVESARSWHSDLLARSGARGGAAE